MEIASGTKIDVVAGSANRGSTRFPDPDRFDIFSTAGAQYGLCFRAAYLSGPASGASRDDASTERLARSPAESAPRSGLSPRMGGRVNSGPRPRSTCCLTPSTDLLRGDDTWLPKVEFAGDGGVELCRPYRLSRCTTDYQVEPLADKSASMNVEGAACDARLPACVTAAKRLVLNPADLSWVLFRFRSGTCTMPQSVRPCSIPKLRNWLSGIRAPLKSGFSSRFCGARRRNGATRARSCPAGSVDVLMIPRIRVHTGSTSFGEEVSIPRAALCRHDVWCRITGLVCKTIPWRFATSGRCPRVTSSPQNPSAGWTRRGCIRQLGRSRRAHDLVRLQSNAPLVRCLPT